MYYYDRFRLDYYDLASFPGPKPGETADDFTFTTLDGKAVRLSDFRGRWVVLETGSLSCNMYTRHIDGMNELKRKYPEVEFLVVYVREAHPGSRIPQHKSLEDKCATAGRLTAEYREERRILLDDMNGSMHRHYGAMPNMVYVIDPDGKVIYRHDWGLVQGLDEVLADRNRIYRNEHAYTFELGALGPKATFYLFKTVAAAGWDALWDLARVLPLFLVEHFRVDRIYRRKEAESAGGTT